MKVQKSAQLANRTRPGCSNSRTVPAFEAHYIAISFDAQANCRNQQQRSNMTLKTLWIYMFTRLTLITLLSVISLQAQASLVTWTQNNHQYQLVEFAGTWDEANSQLAQGWHLATLTSQAEQVFVSNAFAQFVGEFWLGMER